LDRADGAARRRTIAAALVLAGLAVGFFAGKRASDEPPQPPERERLLSDTATVLVAVRGLARLESVSFHMERIIDLKERQRRLFGMIEADDELLLVAAGDVIAGIDLAKLGEGDVAIEPAQRRVRLRLPEPEILSTRLDNERTYVHTRKTDLLARRSEQMEGDARHLAERSSRDAARATGSLARARNSAQQTLAALVRSRGYEQVVFETSRR
jgi:hypothetical protein